MEGLVCRLDDRSGAADSDPPVSVNWIQLDLGPHQMSQFVNPVYVRTSNHYCLMQSTDQMSEIQH